MIADINPSTRQDQIDQAMRELEQGRAAAARHILGISSDTSFDGGKRIVGRSGPSKKTKAKRKRTKQARRKNRRK